MRMRAFVLGLLSIVVVGCSSGPIAKATKFTSYEDFQPGPEGGVDLVWAKLGLRDPQRLHAKLAQYDSVIIDQVIVVAGEETLSSAEIEDLSNHLITRIKQAIDPYKTVVEVASPRTLRLSIALSNVETPNPILAVTSSVLPFGLALSTISKVTTGEHTNVGSASIELLVSDASSGQALFAAIDRQAGNKDLSTMIDSLDDAKDAINYWVDRLAITLDGWQRP